MKRAENSNFKNTIEDLRHVIEIQIMHNSKRKIPFINKIASIIFSHWSNFYQFHFESFKNDLENIPFAVETTPLGKITRKIYRFRFFFSSFI
jgi:hypothetical protein